MKKEIIGTLIGCFGEVIESKNKALIGLKGKIIDETKNTIKIQVRDKIKIISKNQVKIKIENEN